MRPYLKIPTWDLTQVVKHLSKKCEALSSNPSTEKKEIKKKKKLPQQP
jgi:hypothetical protein